jgi:hypothetical protein
MTLIRPVVTHTCETWILSVQNINDLLVFERQILRKIFGQLSVMEDGESEVIRNCRS